MKKFQASRTGLVSAAGFALVLTGCHGPNAAHPEKAIAIPVETVTVSPTIAAHSVAFPITVARDREANLSFRVAGDVESMPVRIGESVQKGQIIARLDATPYTAARVRAEADVERLQRAVRRNEELLPAGAIAQSGRDDALSLLSAAQAALTSTRYDERSADLRAPFPGVVLARDVEVGETVTPGRPIARVADLSSPLLATAAVSRAVGQALRPGAGASVFLSDTAPLLAHVRHIGAASDARTGTVEVELVIDGSMQVPSGTVGSVVFAASNESTPGLQRVPAEALLDADGGSGHVYVVDPATSVARRMKVQLAGFDGDWLEVGGLPSDARVITAGAGFVVEGQRVAAITP